jgi:hypothetical protein
MKYFLWGIGLLPLKNMNNKRRQIEKPSLNNYMNSSFNEEVMIFRCQEGMVVHEEKEQDTKAMILFYELE